MHVPAGAAVATEIERLGADVADPTWEALTAMLHRAYAGQIALGLRPLAGRQDADATRRRCRSGETYVAWSEGPSSPGGAGLSSATPAFASAREGAAPRAPAGMILFAEVEAAASPAWFLRGDVAHFSLFAVEPALQGGGVGAALLATVERRALELGFAELALSMAEPDGSLLAYYRRRGFRFIQHWRWPYTNYRSAILSRALRL
ncbi:MAG TPA: GNAT family N-acetyltransferase [Phycisphaerales bacterium]|nr:GNAT family N-acetyltransferase [Phycisphaerales bacterium]HMP38127.1 GNAT family N-acetyltransferase [Phycisphaerales bacterium]